MLVLGRIPDQQIVIAGNIRITVLKVQGHQVKLGIDAPPGVLILRGELVENHPVSTIESAQMQPCVDER